MWNLGAFRTSGRSRRRHDPESPRTDRAPTPAFGTKASQTRAAAGTSPTTTASTPVTRVGLFSRALAVRVDGLGGDRPDEDCPPRAWEADGLTFLGTRGRRWTPRGSGRYGGS